MPKICYFCGNKKPKICFPIIYQISSKADNWKFIKIPKHDLQSEKQSILPQDKKNQQKKI